MQGVNTNTSSYLHKTPQENLVVAEREKKRKYLDSCLHHRSHFSLFGISVDGMLGTEEESTPKQLARHIATKWQQSY